MSPYNTKARVFTKAEIELVQHIIEQHLPDFRNNVVKLSEWIGINNTHVYLAIGGKVTPTLWNALIKKGLLEQPRERIRISSDCSEEERAILHSFATHELGITYAEFIRQLANDEQLRKLITQYFEGKYLGGG